MGERLADAVGVDQPRDVDHAVVHLAALGPPRHLADHRGQDVVGLAQPVALDVEPGAAGERRPGGSERRRPRRGGARAGVEERPLELHVSDASTKSNRCSRERGCRFPGRGRRLPGVASRTWKPCCRSTGTCPSTCRCGSTSERWSVRPSPGTAAPSERELVQRFHVARMTVRQALDALVAEGHARAGPRPRHLRRPPAARHRPAPGVHRGDDRTRAARGVADAAGPPRPGRSRRRPGPRDHRGRPRHPLEAAAPRRRVADVPRGRLPQRGADPRLPAERDAHQPLRRPRPARAPAQPRPRTP